MPDPIHRHAQARPQAPALLAPGRTWSYAALDAAVAATQARLVAAGLEPGDRVVLMPDRTPDTVVLLWALWRLGAVAVPLSTRLPPTRRLAQAERVRADAVVADEAEWEATSRLTLRPASVVKSEGDGQSSPPRRSRDRDATIVFTSGSTGTPKAALHTWANHLYSAKGSNANLPLRPGDRWLASLPLYHVGGLAILVRCALAGAAVALPGPDDALAEALSQTAATHVSCVSTQLRRLLAAHEGPPPALRAALLGGGPIPAPLLDRALAAGWPVLTSYGCTEMASQVTTTPPGAPRESLRTAGTRLPHRRLRIGDDGQIFVAGPPLFRGYVGADGVEDPRTADGWFPTGDRGRLDAQGRLRVLGRMDRMFVSGGENIQPEEIEAALEQLDGVTRAAVVPVPDDEYGRRPVAFVEPDPDGEGDRLRRALVASLPRFKVPDAFYAFPAEQDGMKVDYEALRVWAREAAAPDAR